MRWRAIATVLVGLVLCACRKPMPELAKGPLRIGVTYGVSSLDPHAEDTIGNFAALANIYEPLVTAAAEMRISPCLAQGWESPDPLTWVFRLRPAVTFHRGRPFRAADVVYSLDRARHRPDLEIRQYLQNVTEVSAGDDLTVRIRTAEPSRMLLNKLRFVMIIPAGVSDESLRSTPDGTGPYMFTAWRPGDWMRMTRNERYWGGRPAIRAVEFRLNLSPQDALRGLLIHEYQIALCNSRKVQPTPDLLGRYRVVRTDSLFVPYVGWDLSRRTTPFCSITPNPFRDIRVRRAIGLAIDRRRLLTGLPGWATPVTQLVPRFVFGFNPEIPEMGHDIQQARNLLRDAGFPRGFEVVLHARQVLEEAALMLKQDLADVGINVETRILPNADFFALKRQGATLWLDRWACTSGDASDLLDNLVHSADRNRSRGTFNYEGYANRDLDRAIEESAGIEDVEERRRILQEIMATTARDLVLLPLYNDQDAYAIEKSLAWQPRSDRYIKVVEITQGPQP